MGCLVLGGVRFYLVKGSVKSVESLSKALEALQEGEADVLLIVEGSAVVIRGIKASQAGPVVSAERQLEARTGGSEGVAIVLDQMFRGFSGILERELGGNVEIHEVLGVGLERPVRQGRLTRWPARDDYDVMRIVERLSGEGRRVILFTGDKRLARQVENLGLEGVRVEYMPPNEFPGKEILAREMIKRVRRALGPG